MYQFSHLENGLTVATAEMPHMASASLGIWVGVGGRHEPAPVSGISHFIEHMLFKGTKKRSAKQISQDVEGIGGYLNAFTTEENTCFYAKACANRFPDLWDVLADMFLNSAFDQTELDKERGVIKEELAMYLDQPHQHVQELLNETLWPEQPLGRSLTGTVETLDRMRRTDLVGYLKANYVTGGTLVAAAGNIRHGEVVETISKLAGKIPKDRRPVFQPAQNGQTSPRVRLCTKPIEQTQIALGVRTCSRHDPRRFALRLLSTILGENMSSRLFQVVREDRGLAYSIASSLASYDDTGALIISAGLDTENVESTLKLVAKEFANLLAKAPAAAELRRARDYVIGQLDLSLENTENQMMWLGEQLLAYGKIIPPDEIKEHLNKVTPAQIKAVAKEFLRPERTCLALVSPMKSDKNLLKTLAWG